MKKWIIAFLILLTATVVSALAIESPERVPTYNPFTFQIELPLTNDFTNASIQFDNAPVATIYPSGNCTIQENWIPFLLKCDTFDKDPNTNAGLTAIITHTGFGKGMHTITVYTQGNETETITKQLNVFDPLDEETEKQLSNRIEEIKTKTEGLQNDSQYIFEKANQIQIDLNSGIAGTQYSIQTIKETVNKLDEQVNQVAQKLEDGKLKIPFLDSKNNSPATGLIPIGSEPILGMAFLIILSIGLLFIWRKKQEGEPIFELPSISREKSKPIFEGNLDALFKNVPKEKHETRETSPKKWSSETEEELRKEIEKNPPEKINFGDLVRKERD